MSVYKVIIIEDDPMVADINQRYVQRNRQLEVCGVFPRSNKALAFLEQESVDLILLDFFMPGMNGQEFLGEIRRRGNNTPVIVISAQDDVEKVAEFFCLGILDYIIKPFDYSRFQQAIGRFVALREAIDRGGKLTQEDLDRIMDTRQSSKTTGTFAKKGIQQTTLDTLQRYLTGHVDERLTVTDIAKDIDLSHVTLRRYLNHLVDTGAVVSDVNYTTGGRPSNVFIFKGSGD